MFEEDIIALLNPLVGGNAFFDTTPADFDTTLPHIIVQQVGGRAAWYIDQSMPSHKHARMQIYTWANNRLAAAPLARQVENSIAASAFVAEPYGAPVADNNAALKLFGSRQDFGFWYPDP